MKKVLITLAALMAFSSADAQLANPGFEAWDTTSTGGYNPTDWPLLTLGMKDRVTDAHGGAYALQVSVWYYYGETRAEQVVPIADRPFAFCGYYKYRDNVVKNNTTNLVTPDTANAQVYLTKWNASSMMRDTIGRGRVDLMGSAGYSHFVCPITYSSAAVPDTIAIVMDPSMMREGNYFSTADDGKNSFLTIDDLYLQRWSTNIEDQQTQGRLTVTPNPAHDMLHLSIAGNEAKVVITDVTGKVCVTAAGADVDVRGLQPGVYHISADNNGVRYTATFVKE